MENGMKRYWYATLEVGGNGAEKTSVVHSMEAPRRPASVYVKLGRAEIYGAWFDSAADALAFTGDDFTRRPEVFAGTLAA
jgi:hypothetical protein